MSRSYCKTFLSMSCLFFVVIVCLSGIYVSHASKCGPGDPEVRSPFHLITQYPHGDADALGHPGYELKCSREMNSTTVISFPSYGDLTVKFIDYGTKRIDLIDPRCCVHQVFLELDLNNTPFQHFYYLKRYTYLNCSSSSPADPMLRSYGEIPCMSGGEHKVYTVDVSIAVPSNCRAIKTVEIPFGYSHYISDNTFGLALTWDSPPASNPVADHRVLGWRWSSFVCVIAVAGLVGMKKMYKKQGDQSNKEMKQGIEHLLKDNAGEEFQSAEA